MIVYTKRDEEAWRTLIAACGSDSVIAITKAAKVAARATFPPQAFRTEGGQQVVERNSVFRHMQARAIALMPKDAAAKAKLKELAAAALEKLDGPAPATEAEPEEPAPHQAWQSRADLRD